MTPGAESLCVRFTAAEPALRHWMRRDEIRRLAPWYQRPCLVDIEHWEGVAVDAVDLEVPEGHPLPNGDGALSFETHDGELAWARVDGPGWTWAFST